MRLFFEMRERVEMGRERDKVRAGRREGRG